MAMLHIAGDNQLAIGTRARGDLEGDAMTTAIDNAFRSGRDMEVTNDQSSTLFTSSDSRGITMGPRHKRNREVTHERCDVEIGSAPRAVAGSGRNVIAVIGIDRYHHWRHLANAVHDANEVAGLFQQLGFEQITPPLFDDRATGKAIQSLVTDDLRTLGPDDSLVLFYAGHGGTRQHCLGDQVIKTGYLIPVDASDAPDKVATWIDLEGWLRAVALLPARHILVVLDACHSGIALDPILKWRDIGSWRHASLSTLQSRRSRRIITSALDDQVACDSGPVHGHSLFTGCLIEGLTGGIRRERSAVTTGSELGLYVQRRVETYPGSQQTPDFGTFEFDDRGEMVIPLPIEPLEPPARPTSSRTRRRHAGASGAHERVDRTRNRSAAQRRRGTRAP